MQKKKLILVAAPPACGKNFVSEKIAESCGHIAYFDKDDLCELVSCAFDIGSRERDMDSEFYSENIRPFEYATLMRLALSALKYEDKVLINAPFGKEIRDVGYMSELRRTVNKMGAELVLIWVVAPVELCYERMKQRNAERDKRKLEDWDAYVRNINYHTPNSLITDGAIDKLVEFNNGDAAEFSENMKGVLAYICEERTDVE